MPIRRALLSAVLILSWAAGSGRVLAQDYAPPDPVLPLPLYFPPDSYIPFLPQQEEQLVFKGLRLLWVGPDQVQAQDRAPHEPPAILTRYKLDLPEQLRFNVRLVRVPASLYERLKETFPLEGKKPLRCDERELQALMEAVQSDPQASVLCSPEMLTGNNQSAQVEVGQMQQFATGVRVVSKEGKPAFESVTTGALTGYQTTLTGNLKKEGKSIEIDLRVTGTRVDRVETVPVKLPAGENGEEVTRYVQCPHVAVNTVARKVTLPAGRTLVLPGWWEEGETAEVALPLLGKLPLLNGLFVATPKESQRVLVFVTAEKVR